MTLARVLANAATGGVAAFAKNAGYHNALELMRAVGLKV
jgi:hypothetical protein